MKKILLFDGISSSLLFSSLRNGLSAYATNATNNLPPSTLWLRLCGGDILRIGVEMHDLSGWEEIGTLAADFVDEESAPEMIVLPVSWSCVREIQKIVYNSDECEAECGFSLCSNSGDEFIVVPEANVCMLAIKAPFYQRPFKPEHDLTAYIRKPF
jgi:hypothetical protein